MISTKELAEFKANNNIVLGLVSSPIGRIWAMVEGNYNYACAYECLCIAELLAAANGAGE